MNLYHVVTEAEPPEGAMVASKEVRRTFLAESFEAVHKHVAETFADEQLIAIVDRHTVVTVLSGEQK